MEAATGKTAECVDLCGNLQSQLFPNTLVPQGQEMVIKKATLTLLCTSVKIFSISAYAVEGEEAFSISTTETEDMWDTALLESAISGDNFLCTPIVQAVSITNDGTNHRAYRTVDLTKFIRRVSKAFTSDVVAENVQVDHKIAIVVRSDDTAVVVNIKGFIRIWYQVRPLSWNPIA